MVINGWTTYAHPLFLNQYAVLIEEVERLKAKFPEAWQSMQATKRLAAIHRLAFDIIPQDPTLPEYRLGQTLGPEHRHWFRAKFFQQYRLFFRFHTKARIIVYARMLGKGKPPDDWDALLREASSFDDSRP